MLKKLFKVSITTFLLSSVIGCYGSLELTGVSVSTYEQNNTVNNENNNQITSDSIKPPIPPHSLQEKSDTEFTEIIIKEKPKPPPPKIGVLDQLRTFEEIKNYFYYFEPQGLPDYYIKKGEKTGDWSHFKGHKRLMCMLVTETCYLIHREFEQNRPAPIRRGVLEWINDPNNRKICHDTFERFESIKKCSMATEIVE